MRTNVFSSLLTVIFLSFFMHKGHAQGLEVQLKRSVGIWNDASKGLFSNGSGIAIGYGFPLNQHEIVSSIEIRTIDWGSQLSATGTFRANYLNNEKWSFNGRTSLGLGMAFFRPNSLFVYSFGYTPEISFFDDRKVSMQLGLGIQFNHCPAYKVYGAIDKTMEIPLSLGIRFNGKPQSE